MTNLIKHFIKYPAWPKAIKTALLIFGLAAIFSLRSSFFPEKESNIIQIQAVYPGAAPEEIEKGIVKRIEENLKGVQGLERFTSKSKENNASITVEVFEDYDIDEVLRDVKNAVDRINSFPKGMEPPVVFKQPGMEFAVSFTLTGDVDLKTLKLKAREAENELRSIEGISQVSFEGFPAEEIVVNFREKDLEAYGLTFDQIANRIRQENIELSAGEIKTDEEEILIKIRQKGYYAKDLRDIPIKADRNGRIVRLSEVADVKNAWAENPKKTYLKGRRAAIVNVNKIVGENIIEITEKTKEYIGEFNEKNDKVEAKILRDATVNLRERLNLLVKNGTIGAILVIASLALFLNLRLAFWVALSLPISFLGMFLMLYLTGLTINVFSLFGCIIVIGILVDDGIVVGEQIYQSHEEGLKPFSAAYSGVMNVIGSVFFAILTTIVAFTPFFFLTGRQGSFMFDVAFVVTVTIFFSLFEAAFILPSHLAHSKALRKDKKKSSIREKLNKILLYPRDKWYSKSLKFFCKNWILVLAFAFLLTVSTIGAFRGGIIGATFFPFLDFDSFDISLIMPAGTRESETYDILKRIEKATWEVNKELSAKRDDGKQVIEKVTVNLAQGPVGLFGSAEKGKGNIGTVKVIMLSGEERNMGSYVVKNAIREKVGPVYEAERLTYGEGSRFGKPVSFPLISPDIEELEAAKTELKRGLKSMPELTGVTDDAPLGPREIDIKLKKKAYMLGLSSLEIARQIRQGFFGEEIQRLQRGEDEIKVWSRYAPEDRRSVEKWENMNIRVRDGREIPLGELVDYEIKRSISVINHLNGDRVITVEAVLKNERAEAPPILNRAKEKLLKPILRKYPNVKTAESGQQREIMKTARSSQIAMPVAFVIMFFLISLSFRSISQAFVVIALVPLGLIGAAWGHFVQGIPVSIMSAYGIIALIGIIVNNSIVFINTANGFMKKGRKFEDAVFKAGINRFRPILLTTVTTVLGLLPLLAETSLQAQFLIPMAVSVSYGLLFGAVLTLIFLPVFMFLLNRIKLNFKKLLGEKDLTPEDVEPAVIESRQIKKYFEE